jgi:tetratricopeptide (TPR) repeat protein
LWFLGTLAPVIGVIQVIGGQGMADRYTYIPLIGLFIVLVWGAADGLARAGVRRWVGAVVGGVLLAGCAIGAWQQVGYWHDSLTLWRHALDVDPTNHLAFNNIGTELFTAKEYHEAAACFAKAVEYAPPDHYLGYLARTNYAASLEQLREPEVAVAQYAEIAHTPNNREAQYQLGVKLVDLGKMADAVPPLEAACRIDPNYAPAHVYLGWVFYKERKLPEAVAEYQTAIRIEPSALAYYCLGLALEARLDITGAESQYEAALRLDPKYDAARTRLAVLRQSQ